MNYRLLVFALLLTTVWACSVEQEIYDTLTTDNSLRTQTDVANYVNGAYSRLTSFDGFKAQWTPFYVGGDELNSRVGSSAGIRWSQKTVDEATGEPGTLWRTFYFTIGQANNLLEKAQPLAIDSVYKRRALGEMYFLRAFSYFYLVRMFGPVPVRLKSTELSDNLALGRTSVDSVYRQIFADFNEANRRLILRNRLPASEFGHATKGAAHALLSKAYLTYGNYLDLNGRESESKPYYELARNFADSVIQSGQYTLLNNFGDLWDVDKESAAYQEVVFGIQMTRDAQVGGAGGVGSEFASNFMPSSMPNVAGNTVATKVGAGNYRVQPWFAERYSQGDYVGDYRFERSVLTTWVNTSNRTVITFPRLKASASSNEVLENQPYLWKYVDPKGLDPRNNENDYFAIRLAEVILIKAEAENELNGPTATAYAEFNKIRARARNANGVARTTPANLQPGLTKEQFKQKIWDERSLELFGEGHRWFDLVRFKAPNGKTMFEYQLSTVIPSYASGLPVYNNTTQTWGGGRTEPTSVPAFQQKFLLMPIPFAERSTNPNMTQNPGY